MGIPMPIIQALVKSGVIGAVLAWALIQNVRLTEQLITIIKNNTIAIEAIKSDSCSDFCREATR